MKRMLSFLRRSAALASLVLAMSAPVAVYSADQYAPTNHVAPVGTPIQQVNFNSCPNGNCYNGGGWGGGWGGGSCWGGSCWGNRWGGNYNNCNNCNGAVGIFGCPCHHGLTNGYAFVRPPVAMPLNRVSNMYSHYYSARLAGVPVTQTGLQYPMVYQPTDTAQLGFYYQAVPRWGYRPEMLPPAPSPYWPMGMNGGLGYGYGYGGTVSDGTTPTPATTTPNTTPMNTAPVPPVAPPPPAEPQVNVPDAEATFFPERIRRR